MTRFKINPDSKGDTDLFRRGRRFVWINRALHRDLQALAIVRGHERTMRQLAEEAIEQYLERERNRIRRQHERGLI